MVKFGSLHVVRRVGIISPLGAFFLAHFIDEEDTAMDLRRHPSLRRRHLARQENGELLVIYAGHTAHTLEWARVDLLASALRLEPILDGDDDTHQHASPVLLVTACPVPALSAPVSLPVPYSMRTRSSTNGADEQQHLLTSNNITPAYENELRINFRTFQNALFLYSVADYGDHLIVQLAAGRAEVFFDFGGNQRSQLSGGLALNDGEWHELRWSHHFDTAQLFVDGVAVNSTEIGGLYRKLDLHSSVEIGGRPEEIGDEQIIEFSLENAFYGCLARMELNGLNLLAFAPKLLPSCQMSQPQLVAVGPHSALQIPYSFLPFAFDFHILLQRPQREKQHAAAAVGAVPDKRQQQEDEVPLLSILDMANVTLLQLSISELDDGAMNVRTSLGRGGQAPRVVALGGGVARGWHAVVVKLRGGDALEVELDGRVAYWVEGTAARRIGTTMHTFLLSATGCYRSATIDLKQGVPLGNELMRDQCPLEESCSPNPCRNGGQCVQIGFSSFSCECEQNYTGRFCHISKLAHSCEEHFASGAVASKRALIDLDGGGPLQPFSVECRRGRRGAKKRKFQTKFDVADDEVITVIKHDSPPQGIIVRGITEPGAVRRVLRYGLGESELDRLVGAFEQCGQMMRFQCKGGQRLMHYGAENRPSVWYATRNAQHGLQWGDAPPFSRMCTCALNDSCTGQRGCNCDSGNDAVDIGMNTHQQLLPILQLFIGGGTEESAMANVSIGPLECRGRYVFETITFVDRNQRLIASHSFPSASTFHAVLSVRFARPQLTIFTYASANHERWFQLFVRSGHVVGQLIYAGISHELVSDMSINDNRWHTVSWEVDEQSMRLIVDRTDKTIFVASVPPRASLLIIGARTGKDRSGFAGQMRNFHLNGVELALGQMAQRVLGAGVQLGAWGACDAQNACRNDGRCVELYDAFTCNCSLTPFSGETCENEVGMWVPLGSDLKIAWQHPAQVSNCFRISVQSASTEVALIRARALFAESNFNLSIDSSGHLNVQVFDGFFFSHNVTLSDRFPIADNKSKDIQFCANSTGFEMSINGEQALFLEGNFTFFAALNSWQFVDPTFAGCIARLMVGDAFPLKDPQGSRLQFAGKIRFGSCPYDSIERHKSAFSLFPGDLRENGADNATPDIYATSSNLMKSQRQLLFITPAIGFASALCILLSLCVFLLYIQRRPDGVYKTHERNAFVPIGEGAVMDNSRKQYSNGDEFGTAGNRIRFSGVPTLTHTRLLQDATDQQQKKQHRHTAFDDQMKREYFC